MIIGTKNKVTRNLNTNNKGGWEILAAQDREQISSLLKCHFKSVRKKLSTETLGQDTNMHTIDSRRNTRTTLKPLNI